MNTVYFHVGVRETSGISTEKFINTLSEELSGHELQSNNVIYNNLFLTEQQLHRWRRLCLSVSDATNLPNAELMFSSYIPDVTLNRKRENFVFSWRICVQKKIDFNSVAADVKNVVQAF